MKILKLEVDGFRSLSPMNWEPGDLNVLIGPNAGGKSNLLRVFELMSAAATGGLNRFVLREGGMDAMLFDGRAESLRVVVKTSPATGYTDAAQDALTYRLLLARLGQTSSFRVEHELLANFCAVDTGQSSEPYKLLERDWAHAYVFSSRDERFEAPLRSVNDSETLLSLSAGPFTENPAIAEFQKYLAAWTTYANFRTDNDAPVRAARLTRYETQLDADGQNLAGVLHTLYTSNADFEGEIDAAMQSAFGADYNKLVFAPAADQRTQLRVKWHELLRAQSTADLSDGTLRFLYLLAILANPQPQPLLAIDEPETGLHPSMFPIIAEFAREASRRSQVIFATHSAAFLDAFGREPPTTTIVENQHGITSLRVMEGDQLAHWLKDFTLGELFRSRDLEALP